MFKIAKRSRGLEQLHELACIRDNRGDATRIGSVFTSRTLTIRAWPSLGFLMDTDLKATCVLTLQPKKCALIRQQNAGVESVS
jgi:hypothetical protein